MTTYRTLYIDETNDGIFVGPEWEAVSDEAYEEMKEKEQIVFTDIPVITKLVFVEVKETVNKETI